MPCEMSPKVSSLRRKEYIALDGQAIRAIFKTFEYFETNGIKIAPEAQEMLTKRSIIKQKYPK